MSTRFKAAISIKRFAASYDQRTTTALGATWTRLGATTGCRTTAAPPATQPARTTPAAQTTALASIVLKVMKPPNSSREMIACFITVLHRIAAPGVAMEPAARVLDTPIEPGLCKIAHFS
jgi:hypothetical protein